VKPDEVEGLRELTRKISDEAELELSLHPDPQDEWTSFEGEHIRILGDRQIRSDTRRELYDGPRFSKTVGLDASSTRTMTFDSGLQVCIANAGFGGRHRNGSRTMVGGTNWDVGTDEIEMGDVSAQIISVPDTGIEDYDTWLTSACQFASESQHLNNNDIESPLFIDGYIYPSVLRFYAEEDDFAEDLFESYVTGVESLALDGIPVIGVTKTHTSGQIVREINGPWKRDSQFMSSLLSGDMWTWTPWILEEEVKRKSDWGALTRGIETEMSPRQLRRVFFFVRDPDSGNVYRVQVPWEVWQTSNEEDLQRAIIAEMCETQDIPEAVKRADKMVHISQDLREQISQQIEDALDTNQITDYDEDVRER
jgi:hypothetical protein